MIKDIQDRIYAINQTISGVTALRYFPQTIDSALMPALFALPMRFQRNTTNSGANQLHGSRTFTLFLVVWEMGAGIPTETAQEKAEAAVELVWDAYAPLKRLDLDHNPLNTVSASRLIVDTGIIPYRFSPVTTAAVEFTLEVTIHRSV